MVELSTHEPAAPAEAEPPALAPESSPSPPAAAEPAAGKGIHGHHRAALLLILAFHAATALWMAVLRGPYDAYFYDEKFNMENVVQIVTTHGLEPANGWYSLLSYLPQAVVAVAMDEAHQRTGHEWLRVIDPEAEPPYIATYNVFMAARLLGIVYGCLSLWLVFRLGARLFSPATGLFAATGLAVSPWMIRTSVEFKPDALLLLTTLLAVLLMVRFLERPSLGRFLWVGAGLGLAATSKMNGTFIGPVVALVGVVGAFLVEPRGFREAARRIALWGGAGAAVAAAVFFATTPYFKLMLFYMGRIERFYGQRAGVSTPRDVIVQASEDLAALNFLGPVLYWLAAAGLVVLLFRLFERQASAPLKASRLLLVLTPLCYATVLAFTMRYYKQNNLVQLLPFLCLLAALALTTLGSASERLPRWLGRSFATLVTLAFLGHAGWLALSFSYEENVPYDWQVLNGQLRTYAKLDAPRVIVYEGVYETIPSYRFGRKSDGAVLWPSVRWLDDASQVERERLDLADAVVLRRDLGGPQRNSFVASLLAAVPPDAVTRVEAHPLKVRGHGYVTLFHLWRFRDDGVGEPTCQGTADKTIFSCRLPEDFRAGEVAALHFTFWSKKVGVAEIRVGGEEGEALTPLTTADLGGGNGWEAMSERFVVPGPGTSVWLRFEMPIEGPLQGTIPVTASRWLPPQEVALEIPPPFKSPFAKATPPAPKKPSESAAEAPAAPAAAPATEPATPLPAGEPGAAPPSGEPAAEPPPSGEPAPASGEPAPETPPAATEDGPPAAPPDGPAPPAPVPGAAPETAPPGGEPPPGGPTRMAVEMGWDHC